MEESTPVCQTTEEVSINQTDTNEGLIDQIPVDQMPADQATVDQATVDQDSLPPVDQAPFDQAPIDQAPIDQAPVDQAEVDQGSAGIDEMICSQKVDETLPESQQLEEDNHIPESKCKTTLFL